VVKVVLLLNLARSVRKIAVSLPKALAHFVFHALVLTLVEIVVVVE
jgi:hypothetical protein